MGLELNLDASRLRQSCGHKLPEVGCSCLTQFHLPVNRQPSCFHSVFLTSGVVQMECSR